MFLVLVETLVIESRFKNKPRHLRDEVLPASQNLLGRGGQQCPFTVITLKHCVHSGSLTRCLVTRPRWADQINISCLQRAELWGNCRIHTATISPHFNEEELQLPLHSTTVPRCCVLCHTDG